MFTKSPTPPARSAAPAASGSFSVLGADLAVTGDLVAQSDLHIEGSVTGDVSCAALVQGADSVITGAIRAEAARLAGTVRGTIDVRELTILATARIEGDVRYDAVTIEHGGKVDGQLTLRVDPPALSVVAAAE